MRYVVTIYLTMINEGHVKYCYVIMTVALVMVRQLHVKQLCL